MAPRGTGFANSAEFFESQIAQQYHDPYYHWGHGPWYLDSGASRHIAADYNKLDPNSSSSGVQINETRTGGGEPHVVKGSGTATVSTKLGAIKLKEVQYVPSMMKNLVSVGALADAGHCILFLKQYCWIVDTDNYIVASAQRDSQNGLYSFKPIAHALTVDYINTTQLWHRRMGHLNHTSLQFLSRSGHVIGLPPLNGQKQICHCCLSGN